MDVLGLKIYFLYNFKVCRVRHFKKVSVALAYYHFFLTYHLALYIFVSLEQSNGPPKKYSLSKDSAFHILRVLTKMADFGADLAKGFILSCLLPCSCALSLFFMISFKCLHSRVFNIAKDVEIVQSGQYIFELMKSSAIPHWVSKSWLKE